MTVTYCNRAITVLSDIAHVWHELPLRKRRHILAGIYVNERVSEGACRRCLKPRDRAGSYCSACLVIHNRTSNVGWQERRRRQR